MSKPTAENTYKRGDTYDYLSKNNKDRPVMFVPVTEERDQDKDGHRSTIYVKNNGMDNVTLNSPKFEDTSDLQSSSYSVCDGTNTTCFTSNDGMIFYNDNNKYLANPKHTLLNNIKRFGSRFMFSGGRRSRRSRKTKRIRRRRTVRRVR